MGTKKLIVVTGGSRGCGRALVDWFAAEGHTVISCARSAKGVEELRAAHGTPHDFQTVDLADAAAVAAWAKAVIAQHGAPDLLINNAAVIAQNSPLWTVPAAQIESVLRVNVGGTVNTIREFVPAMIGEGRGVIVNFSSGWGRSTSPDVAIYCASKFAIEGLTQALAQELPTGLAAVALNPGIIDTDMLRSCFGSGAANYPKPGAWVKKAGPFFLSLGPRHNGQSLDVPGIPTD